MSLLARLRPRYAARKKLKSRILGIIVVAVLARCRLCRLRLTTCVSTRRSKNLHKRGMNSTIEFVGVYRQRQLGPPARCVPMVFSSTKSNNFDGVPWRQDLNRRPPGPEPEGRRRRKTTHPVAHPQAYFWCSNLIFIRQYLLYNKLVKGRTLATNQKVGCSSQPGHTMESAQLPLRPQRPIPQIGFNVR
jgi:hypothetical protein